MTAPEPYRFIRRIVPGQSDVPERCDVCDGPLTTAVHAYLFAAGPDHRLVTHPLCGPAPDPYAVHCPNCLGRLTKRRVYDPLKSRWDHHIAPCLKCDSPDAA